MSSNMSNLYPFPRFITNFWLFVGFVIFSEIFQAPDAGIGQFAKTYPFFLPLLWKDCFPHPWSPSQLFIAPVGYILS